MAKSGCGRRGHFLDALLAANVELDGKSAAAKSSYFRFERGNVIKMAAREDNICTRLREGTRHVLTEAAACASDKRNAPREVEEPIAHETVPGVRITFIRFGSRA